MVSCNLLQGVKRRYYNESSNKNTSFFGFPDPGETHSTLFRSYRELPSEILSEESMNTCAYVCHCKCGL